MRCAACATENPPRAKFCLECATPLPRQCTKCGSDLPPAAKFCMECAHPVAATAAPASAPGTAPHSYTPPHLAERILAARPTLKGERKQVTILFADVVGSTELIRDRDPEEAQRLLDGAVQVMMDAVHRYEGTVSRLMGDGLMAIFGAPLSLEDHAVRACYAALAMHATMRRHLEDVRRTHGVTFNIRSGLSAGEVVVRTIRDDLHMDYTAMGQTVHLASRMEQLSEPGTATITAETLALVEGYVQVRSLGPVPVKGLDAPVEVYQLLGAGYARTRLQATAGRGLTRFVGRQAELDALHAALERARTGHGQVAALVGEPGVGKSRLVWELTHSHRVEGWLTLESGSVSYGKATSYLPVIDLLKAYCRIEAADDARAIREKVTGKLLTLDRALEPSLPALLALLDALPPDDAWSALDPALRRRQTIDAVRRLLLRESQEQSLLLVFEDLHWIDSETQALLDSLVDSLPTARIVLLVNYRPEYSHAWGNRGFYAQFRIDPLAAESADELLVGLLGADPSLDALKTVLIERTEGNPLFLEEMTRSLVETGALTGERGAYRLPLPLASIRVPATVQAVLAARIDRLPAEEKRLLQTAAVVGKDVPVALLEAVAGLPDHELQHGLAALQSAEFLYEASLFPDPEYTFKHALTHEVAYGSLLQERRKTLHARVVDAIERHYPDRLVEHVERLADHALRAEEWLRAARYAHQAGLKARARSAYREASTWLEESIRALDHRQDSVENRQLAVDVRLDLRPVLGVLGLIDQERTRLTEAETIVKALGDEERLRRTYAVMIGYFRGQSDYDHAREVAERAQRMAAVAGDVALQVFIAFHLARISQEMGELRQAVDGFRSCIAVLVSQPGLAQTGPHDVTEAACRSILGEVLSDLGDFDEAIDAGIAAARLRDETGEMFTLAVALSQLALVYVRRGDIDAATPLLERGIEIARAREVKDPLAWGLAILGVALTLKGDPTAAAPLLEQALEIAAAHSHLSGHASWAIWLGEAYLASGRHADARRTVTSGLDFAVTHRERPFQAYGLRALGEVAASEQPPDVAEAEARYREALVLAEEIGMRPLQAHCHFGLGKLYHQLGRLDDARSELTTTIAMLREMGMTHWLPEAEAELALVSPRPTT